MHNSLRILIRSKMFSQIGAYYNLAGAAFNVFRVQVGVHLPY